MCQASEACKDWKWLRNLEALTRTTSRMTKEGQSGKCKRIVSLWEESILVAIFYTFFIYNNCQYRQIGHTVCNRPCSKSAGLHSVQQNSILERTRYLGVGSGDITMEADAVPGSAEGAEVWAGEPRATELGGLEGEASHWREMSWMSNFKDHFDNFRLQGIWVCS